MQNRGYDSVGIWRINKKIIDNKYASHSISAINKLENIADLHSKSKISIGHTRWPRHGGKTDYNSHPHISYDNKFPVVQLIYILLIQNEI